MVRLVGRAQALNMRQVRLLDTFTPANETMIVDEGRKLTSENCPREGVWSNVPVFDQRYMK